ncbi:unnamed protein product [Parnassius apollo]|uniref:(apollo) hypothetical protein n=1 Tax=Parnassius apollo TaxID=110799 RepID=A0A8S3WN49_PARAO|nr:unnamed protein product [Parnassius apollo]
MAAKQSIQTKKEMPSNLGRSVMLTRFKLSQQKRQLREKDRRMTHITQLLKSPHLLTKTKDNKEKSVKTSPKLSRPSVKPSKKEKPLQTKKSSKVEFCPNKVKRNIVAKKIVLKPRHELKVIGSTNGVNKRKLDMTQKVTDNGSQSPIYSELGFEEVIRMADETQNLDDEDLLEILTCPSPVWWEDPPDDNYLDDPIIMKSPKSSVVPTLIKQFKSKPSRKKKPHKVILESNASKENESGEHSMDVGTIMDSTTLNTNSKSDDKFKNKRSKLENLLSNIKDKLCKPKTDQDGDNIKDQALFISTDNSNIDSTKTLDDANNSHPKHRQETVSESTDDSLFPEMSLSDHNSLKLLENMEIPVEGKKQESITQGDETIYVDILPDKFTSLNKIVNTIKHLRNTKNDFSKRKTINIKNIKLNTMANLSSNKNVSSLSESIETVTKLSQDDIKPNRNKDIQLPYVDELEKKCDEEEKLDNSVKFTTDTTSEKSNEDMTEEYITVFKIISNDTDVHKDDLFKSSDDESVDGENSVLFEDISHEKETDNFTIISKENENIDKDQIKLNSYYKKCKNVRRGSKKLAKYSTKDNKKTAETIKPEKKERNIENDGTQLCDDCNIDSKNSIIVPSTTDVKYCLKCSSIFDLDECNYCLRKAKGKQNDKDEPGDSNSENVDNEFEVRSKNINSCK